MGQTPHGLQSPGYLPSGPERFADQCSFYKHPRDEFIFENILCVLPINSVLKAEGIKGEGAFFETYIPLPEVLYGYRYTDRCIDRNMKC